MVFIPSGSKKVTKFRDDQFFRNPQANIHDLIDFVNKKVNVEVCYQPISIPLLFCMLPACCL